MTTLVHNSPLGDLDIPGVGTIPPGEPFEVDDPALAEKLLEQQELFTAFTKPKPKAARQRGKAAAEQAPDPTPTDTTAPTTTEGENQ
jgi:hypothetical protein